MAKSKQGAKSKGAKPAGSSGKSGGSGSVPVVDTDSAARAAAAMLLHGDTGFAGKSGGMLRQIKQDLARGGPAGLGPVLDKTTGAGAKPSNFFSGGKGPSGHHQKSGLGGNRQGVPRRTANG